MVSIKKGVVVVLSMMLLLIMTYSALAVQNWNVWFPWQPYAQNGPGLHGDSCEFPAHAFFQAPTPGLCTVNSSWDLGAVYTFYDANTIYWKITGMNFRDARFCGGTNNVSIIIGMNTDGLTTTGNMYNGKPAGFDYIFYINGTFSNMSNVSSTTAHLFYHNATTAPQQTAGAFLLVTNASPIVEINVTGCNATTRTYFGYTENVPPHVLVAVNKSFLNRTLSFNYTQFVATSNNPVASTKDNFSVELDILGFAFDDAAEHIQKDTQGYNKTTFNAESKFGCAQFKGTNALTCENNTVGEQCKWSTDFNDCYPKAFLTGGTGFSCAQFCGECTTQATCVNNTKCQWSSTGTNFKTGGTGTCYEKYFVWGKNCDSSCGDCETEILCNASKVPDPTGLGGAGCKWVNDSGGHGWCTLSSFNTESLTCSVNYLERCRTSTECTAKGGVWDTTYNYCKPTGNTEICYDGIDNDGDGSFDCSDSDCLTKYMCGGDINIGGGGFNSTNQFECLKQKYMKDFIVDAPPVDLGADAVDAALVNNDSHLDIIGLAVGDSDEALFLAITVKNVTPFALCGTGAGHANKTATYVYLLDVDANASTGCGVNISNVNKTGFEYQITYFVNYTAALNNYTELKTARLCIAATNTMAFAPVKLIPPMEDGAAPNKIMGCRFDKVGLGVPYDDITDPDKIKISAAVFDNTTNLSYPNDTLLDVVYEAGQVDFEPVDCFSNPTACGSMFSGAGSGKFMPFQDCFSDYDTDNNGYAGCADPMCTTFPRCQGVSGAYNAAADTDPPTVISSSSYPFKSFVDLKVITSEPTNLSVTFYNQSKVCAEAAKNGTVVDNPPFAADNFRPFHGMPVTNTTPKVGGIFGPSLTLFYKTKTCDRNGNCAISHCQNFTVAAASAAENVSFKFEMPANSSTNALLGSLNLKIKNGTTDIPITNGSVKNLASYLQNATLVIENVNQSATPYSIEITGVDLTKTLNTNMTTGINATNFSSNGTFIGLGSDVWNELVQNTGADTIQLNISVYNYSNSALNTSQASPYDNIFKCASDNITSCTNVTSNCTKLGGGNSSVNWVQWEIPSSLGFSVYGYSGAGNTGSGSSGSSGTSTGGGGNKVTPVTTPVATPIATPATVAKTQDKTGAAQSTEPAAAPAQTADTTEVTTVASDGSISQQVVEKSAAQEKQLASKRFDQLFGGAGSGIGALIVLVLVVVIIVGIMYYKKKKQG